MNDNDKQLQDVSRVNTITTKIMQINTLCKLLFAQWDVCVTCHMQFIRLPHSQKLECLQFTLSGSDPYVHKQYMLTLFD